MRYGDISVTCGDSAVPPDSAPAARITQTRSWKKREEVETYRQGGFGWRCWPCSPPARRLSGARRVPTRFPAANMSHSAGRTRFQQDAVSKVRGTASTGEVGIFPVKVEDETRPPVRFRFGSPLLAALVPDRYALLFVLN